MENIMCLTLMKGVEKNIKTDIHTVEEAYDVVYNDLKVLIDQRKELYNSRNKDSQDMQ